MGPSYQLLSPAGVSVIAHRGGSALRPENTTAAFDHAASLSVTACECDVHLSRDGEVVVIHDATLDRTTDARGPVGQWAAADLGRVDAAYRFGAEAGFPFRGRGFGVPRLADVLARHPGLAWVIEIKGDRPEVVSRVVGVIREAGAEGRVIVGGFSQPVIDAVRRQAPELATSASREEARSAVRRAWFRLAPRHVRYQVFQVPFRLQGRQKFDRTFVRVARRAGVPVQAWTIDDAADMRRLIDWGVAAIISDRPDVAGDVVKSLAFTPPGPGPMIRS
jgi:glycerophosphoryl diester phosphodiesterase